MVIRGSLFVARDKKCTKLYVTHPKISNNIVNVIENIVMTDLLHKRLDNMSGKGMSLLSRRNVLSGVHVIQIGFEIYWRFLEIFGNREKVCERRVKAGIKTEVTSRREKISGQSVYLINPEKIAMICLFKYFIS